MLEIFQTLQFVIILSRAYEHLWNLGASLVRTWMVSLYVGCRLRLPLAGMDSVNSGSIGCDHYLPIDYLIIGLAMK